MKPGEGLDQSVRYLKGVGPKRAETLERLGIRTVEDLLYFLPRSYEDRSNITPIGDLKPGVKATIKARIKSLNAYTARRRRQQIVEIGVTDGTGFLSLVWFQTAYLKEDDFQSDKEMFFTGKVQYYQKKDRLQMVAPRYDPADGEDGDSPENPILPEYPLTEGLNQTAMRKMVRVALQLFAGMFREILPDETLKANDLPEINQAVVDAHFPESTEIARRARRRFAYEELFLLELAMAMRRQNTRTETGHSFEINEKINERFHALFPFSFTGAQERSIAEIAEDIQKNVPMNRLLQGDVGSGKTAVALYPLLVAVANKYQAAIMAPTEILAEQHFRRFNEYLKHGRVRMELLRGGAKPAERRRIIEDVASGEIDLLVGTHALIQRDVDFLRLGAVVVDEQHKFGVMQRSALRAKGLHPHVLVMTATPIPRSLALTVFGDLDVSVLDEMPPGRKPIDTKCVKLSALDKVYKFTAGKLKEGRQAFVVYPLVEESETLDIKAATSMAEELARGPFRGFRVGLLHGRMSADEKERVMREFRDGETDLLVTTLVVEVGVDVANATIMIVEHAERFGLSQLHQLRGRIGRGEEESYCFLVADPKTEDAVNRLKALVKTSDGFKISEEDLRIRGPGEFFGTRQHGLPEMKIADIINDFALLRLARRDAFALIQRDPELQRPENAAARKAVMERFKDKLELFQVG